MDPLEEVELDGPEKFTYISSLLTNEEKAQLRLVLLPNLDVFAWRHSNLVGISSTVASYILNVFPIAKSVRQRVRQFHPNRHQIIQSKVDNLLATEFIREVKYPKWLPMW